MVGFCIFVGWAFGGCGSLVVGFCLLGGWFLGGLILVFSRWVLVLGGCFLILGGL